MDISFFQYFQFLSLLAAICFIRGLRKFDLLPLFFIILISNLCDLLGSFDPKVFGTDNNYWIFNGYILLSYPCYCLLFNTMLQLSAKRRKIIRILQIALLAGMVLNYFFLEGSKKFNSYSLIVSELFWIVLSCFTLLQLALNEQLQPVLLKHPYFYTALGTLLFSLGAVVILGLQQYISANKLMYGNVNIYNPVMSVLNIILFSLYTYTCFLCRQKSK